MTDASPLGIRFLVRDTLLVPWGVVDEQAASHCGQHDMAYRRAGSEHTVAGSLVLNYDCVPLADTRRAEVRRTPPRQAGGDKAAPAEARAAPLVEPATPPTPAPADPKPAVADSKAAAWQKAKTATDAWALCLERGAERRAREADDPPQVAAQAVLDGCSRLERAVHEPLRAAGEDTPGFQTDLHTQAVQRVSQTIVRTRQKANGPVAVGEHVGDPAPEAR